MRVSKGRHTPIAPGLTPTDWLRGSYHQVSAKHLDAYLDELEFRFNNRENPYMFRDAMLKLVVAGTPPYGWGRKGNFTLTDVSTSLCLP